MPDNIDNSAPTGEPSSDADAGIDFDSVIDKWTSDNAQQLFTGPESSSEPAEPAVPVEPPAPEPPAPASAQAPPEPPPEPPAPTETQLAALAKKEEQLLAANERLKQLEAKLAQLTTDPVAALKALEGIDAGLVGVQLLAEDMGDAAPPEFKDQIQKRAEQARIQKIEATQKDLEERVAAAARKATFDTQVALLDRDIQSTLTNIPEDMPFLKRFAAQDPTEALRGVSLVAAEAIKAGRWPSAVEVAKAFNAGLQADYERLAPASQPAPQAKQETRKTPTISDAEAADRPRAAVDPNTVHSDDYYQKRALQVIDQMGGLIKD